MPDPAAVDPAPGAAAEAPETARFVPPRRRRGPLLVVGAITVAVVVALIYLMARGPDAAAAAQRVVDSTLAALPDGPLAAADVRGAAGGLRRALGIHPGSESAREATDLLRRRVAQQIDTDTLEGTLERAEEVLLEANAQWPEERDFAEDGTLRSALDEALERRRLSREAAELLAVAEERLAADPSGTRAIRDALDMLRRALELDPDNARAQAVRDDVRGDVLAGARKALGAGETEEAGRLLDVVAAGGLDDPELSRLRAEVERQAAERARALEIRRLLGLAERRLAADRLTSPPGDNAAGHYRAVLRLDPDNQTARDGLERVVTRYDVLIRDALEDDAIGRAERLFESLEGVSPDHPAVGRLRDLIATARRAAEAAAAQPDPEAPAALERQPVAQESPARETGPEDIPTDPEGRLWFEVRSSCVDAELRRYIEAYPAGRYIEEAWRRISSCIEAR